MPEISRFFGIVIKMYFNDHNPPHFHAEYDDAKGVVDIQTGALIEGTLPPRVLGLVHEWAAMHKDDLLEDWELARKPAPLRKIAPLE